jgi:membrane protease subunit HflC
MLQKIVTALVALAVLVGFAYATGVFYTIDETEQVVITQFGKPIGNAINADENVSQAGLHLKLPFIQQVNRFHKNILEWDGPSKEMTTRDKLYIVVDTFARWRIEDPLKFFQSLRDTRTALSRLDDIIGSETPNVVARHDLIEVVRSDKARVPEKDMSLEATAAGGAESLIAGLSKLPPITTGRQALEKEIFKAASEKVKIWGIELLDVRIKRLNYKSGVIDKIYDRMKSERMQIADRFRSEGSGEAAKIDGKRERDLQRIESEAYRQVEEIKGQADAKASQIYSTVYGEDPLAAEFYSFVKTLDTYRATLGRDSTLVLTTDSDLFRLLKNLDQPTNAQPAVDPNKPR